MTFNEIPLRMMKLAVDRTWLANQCDYKPGTLAAILAPNGNKGHKTEKALRRIWEALDREETRQTSPTTATSAKCQLVIHADYQAFTKWNEAALDEQQTMEQWIICRLNIAAATRALLTTAENEKPAADDIPTAAEDHPEYP